MSMFAAGDVCLIVADTWGRWPETVGHECTIIGTSYFFYGSWRYKVSIDNLPGDWYCAAAELRKKRPPADQKKQETDKPELGEWELCPWKPREVTA